MLAGLLALLVTAADTARIESRPDTIPMGMSVIAIAPLETVPPPRLTLPAVHSVPVSVTAWQPAPIDTGTRKRQRGVAYSEWYGRRVAIHKTLSYAMLPLFAVSYYTGTQLADKGRDGVSGTVRTLHPIAAGGAATIFGVNTVTGVWNLWASRHDPVDRKRRYLHATLFLLADAGFAYAGSLGSDAGDDGAIRSRHRAVALGSMGVSTAGWLVMLLRR
ncbi:MAG: hypothetical protein V4813_07905 [Gemmatimonadota bacterium]